MKIFQLIKNRIKPNIILGFLLFWLIFFAGYICLYKLGSFPFENWDEAWVADAVRNMIRKNEYVVLQWNQEVWLDKPPMYFWLSTIFSNILGFSEFSLRLTSALAGLILIVWVLLYCYKSYGFIPSLLAFSSLALNNIFIWRARSGNLDVFASLLIFVTYFVVISKNRYKYPILGFLFAAIYLTKTSLVLFPLSVFFLHELLFSARDIKKNLKEYMKLFFIFLLFPGIWLLAGWSKLGLSFVNYYLFYSGQGVTRLALSNFKLDYIWYTYYSLQRRFFWVLVMGVLFSLRKITKPKYLTLIFYSLILLVGLSFTEKKNNWYLIPLMPFWSILIAYGTYMFINIFSLKFFKSMIILIVIVLSGYVSYRTYTINIKSVIDSQTTLSQAKISMILNKITQEDDIVVRLDHLYPTTIVYSDRRVLASPENSETRAYFISREDLLRKIYDGEIKWIVGRKSDLEYYSKKNFLTSQVMVTEGDEEIIKIK